MTNDIQEYYPNGKLKHYASYHPNGNKQFEQYYDEDEKWHNNFGPDCQYWYNNGYLSDKLFTIHGERHNICNPAVICYARNGKINRKSYCIDDRYFSDKLDWINNIKYV